MRESFVDVKCNNIALSEALKSKGPSVGSTIGDLVQQNSSCQSLRDKRNGRQGLLSAVYVVFDLLKVNLGETLQQPSKDWTPTLIYRN